MKQLGYSYRYTLNSRTSLADHECRYQNVRTLLDTTLFLLYNLR